MSKNYSDKERSKWQAQEYERWKIERDKNLSKPVDDPIPAEAETLSPDQEEQRRRNREKYPEIAAFVDEVRKHFPGARVVSITPRTPKKDEAMNQALASPELDELVEPDDPQ
jgi:hypothetical protein